VANVETSIPSFTRRQIVYQATDCFPATDCLPGGRLFTRWQIVTKRQISLKNGKETTAFFTGSFLGFIFYCKFAGYKNINFGGTNNENQKS